MEPGYRTSSMLKKPTMRPHSPLSITLAQSGLEDLVVEAEPSLEVAVSAVDLLSEVLVVHFNESKAEALSNSTTPGVGVAEEVDGGLDGGTISLSEIEMLR